MDTKSNVVYSWPCEYCKVKFMCCGSVIYHELYSCVHNPKFRYTSEILEGDSIKTYNNDKKSTDKKSTDVK